MDRLKKRRDFLRVTQKGSRTPADAFIVQSCPQPEEIKGDARLGFTVTKKVGNAVARNRIRRRLKAALHLLEKQQGPIRAGWDYVIIPRSAVLVIAFERLYDQLKRVFYPKS